MGFSLEIRRSSEIKEGPDERADGKKAFETAEAAEGFDYASQREVDDGCRLELMAPEGTGDEYEDCKARPDELTEPMTDIPDDYADCRKEIDGGQAAGEDAEKVCGEKEKLGKNLDAPIKAEDDYHRYKKRYKKSAAETEHVRTESTVDPLGTPAQEATTGRHAEHASLRENLGVRKAEADAESLSGHTFLTNDGKRMTYNEAVDRITARAERHMASMDVDEAVKTSVIADMKAELIKQHAEAESRGIGDHGIRHIYGNIERGENYLMSRDDVTDEQRLAVLVSQVYHDEGYTTSPNNLGVLKEGYSDENHDAASLDIWNEAERQNIYKKVFSPESLKSIETAIGEHNSKEIEKIQTNTALTGDPIVSTVHICDKLALSQREKFSELLSADPKIVELTEGMSATFAVCRSLDMCDEYGKPTEHGKLLCKRYHQLIYDRIDSQGYEPEYADRLKAAVDKDIGFNSGRYSSRMNYIYTPSDCYRYNAETGKNEISVSLINYPDSEPDLRRAQVGKLLEDFGVNLSEEEIDAAIQNGAYDDLSEERGLYIRINTVSEEEIRAVEELHFQENNDFKQFNECIEAGRKYHRELSQALSETALLTSNGKDITFNVYKQLAAEAHIVDDIDEGKFMSCTAAEKKRLVRDAVSEMILSRASQTLNEKG